MSLLDTGLEVDEHMEGLLDLSHSKKIIMLPLTQLEPNKLNPHFDTIDELKQFAEEIYEQGGIRDPLHVYHRNSDNKYVILGGHKRYYACCMNRDKYPDAQSIIPAIVEDNPEDEVHEIIMIEELNQHRNYTDEQLLARARILNDAYIQLVERNQRPPGEKRKWFAKKLNCGIKKAERFIHIIEGRYDEEDTKLKSNQPKFKNSPNVQFEDVRIHLQRKLKTKVKITNKTVSFSYSSIEDFNRLLELLGCENVVNE